MFTVSVGNIQVGGTGKTPHVEYLINLFQDERIAVLSRGYGRSTTGFLKADQQSTPKSIGDEPFQIYQKFKEKINVYVSENRPKGVLEILKFEQPTLLLLDDAYQHQYIERNLNLLLTTFNQTFDADELLPVGKLREPKIGASRADALIVSKSPDQINDSTKVLIEKGLGRYCEVDIPIFYSSFAYGPPVGYLGQTFDYYKEVTLISGIGIPDIFEKYGEVAFKVVDIFTFPDHHVYVQSEIFTILQKNDKVQFVTTEKDFVKIDTLLTETEKKRFFYVPIKVKFEDAEMFNTFVLRRFKKYQSC